ncbi:MAG: DNA alkylation repair protein, partial [Pseudomonadota bacterium]
PDHDAARRLWQTGRYEARIMAVLVADPDKLTSDEADDWCAAFDNWAICDTACFALIDRTAYRWEKVHQWCNDPREYVRRAGFALIWALTTHDTSAGDAVFEDAMTLMEAHASDDRPMVKKAIDMALRATGKRNMQLHASAIEVCNRLLKLEGSAGWIGRHALKELQSEKVLARLQKRGQ